MGMVEMVDIFRIPFYLLRVLYTDTCISASIPYIDLFARDSKKVVEISPPSPPPSRLEGLRIDLSMRYNDSQGVNHTPNGGLRERWSATRSPNPPLVMAVGAGVDSITPRPICAPGGISPGAFRFCRAGRRVDRPLSQEDSWTRLRYQQN